MLASSVMNLGSVRFYQNDYDTAFERLKHAQAIRLAHASDPTAATKNLKRDLGMGYYTLALTHNALDETTEAEINFQAAITAFQQLLEIDPTDMNHRRKLAACHRMAGEVQSKLGNSAKAIAFYEQAKQTLAQLRLRNPEMLEYTSDLAGVSLHLGLELNQQAQTELALESIEEAIALLEALTQQTTSVPKYRLDLAQCLREAGMLLATTQQLQQATSKLRASQQVLSQLMKEEPSNEKYASELQLTNDELARVAAREEKAILEETNQMANPNE